MKKIAAILAGLMACTLPGLGQKLATPSNVQLKTVAWQDKDDRKPQGDQDDQNRKDRDKDKKDRDRKDRDRDDRDRDRARGDRDNDNYNRGDNDGDRGGYYGNGNGQYGDRDRDRNGGYYGNQYGRSYHNVLAPEWQQKFDSYYQRWQQYRATNNRGEMTSMEKRMQDIMVHYNIPSNVPYDQVASPGVGRRY